jgi:biopolymer transport protein ExbB/TolQ
LVVAALFVLGGFISESVFRRKRFYAADTKSEELAEKIAHDLLNANTDAAVERIEKYIKELSLANLAMKEFLRELSSQIARGIHNLDIRTEKVLYEYEDAVHASLEKTRVMVRVGPMLGLMGTLIPMGPALLSLSKGDLTQMANCLILAFGTTVAGLAVGVLAYIISVVRERWYGKDIRNMEYIVDLIIWHIKHNAFSSEDFKKQNLAVMTMNRG